MDSIASSYIKGKKWFRKTIDSRGKQVPQLDTFVQHDTLFQTFHSINEETGEIEKKNIPVLDIAYPEIPKQIPSKEDINMKLYKHILECDRETMKKNRFIFIEGEKMYQILHHVFGAKLEDFETFKDACNNNFYDPYMPFRTMGLMRMGLDLKMGTATRLERQPYILTEKEGFKRVDAGKLRFFGEPEDWIMENTVFQAIVKFLAFFIYGVDTICRYGCDPKRNFNFSSFFVRTITTPSICGEPASEGVHGDGVEYTMTMLTKSSNVDYDSGSAVTRLLSLDEQLGIPAFDVNPNNVLQKLQHRKFLDTALFCDNEMYHCVTPVYQLDSEKQATRDMMIVFIRRMAKLGGEFASSLFDLETPHENFPFAMSIKDKNLSNLYPKTEILKSGNHLLKEKPSKEDHSMTSQTEIEDQK